MFIVYFVYSGHIKKVLFYLMKGCDGMGSKYTDAQKKASIKYIQDKTDDIRIRAPKGTKDRWKLAADAAGVSLTQYVVDAVDEKMERDRNGTA